VQGSELVGRSYGPLFPFFAIQPGAFRVLAGDFVTDEDGTGVVHIAPGFGEDDQKLCDANGIGLVVPVDERGRFTAEVPPYEGKNVILEANPEVIKDLKAAGRVVRHETIVHSYPHCWRTDQPLIYKAVSSWFVEVTKFRDRMVELNQQIEWFPEHVRDGAFGKWLENARDWSISRNRYWGSPIPVWKSDNPAYPRIDIYGSIEELQRDFGGEVTDLHRPNIDDLVRPNPDDPSGESTMRRVPEVLDCWFESGSMTFAQNHYPFENREWFENHFPADFIVEYVGQTRGWFYTMHVLSTALFDKPPFKRCVAHGIVLGEDGRKMSKKLRNYPDPVEMFETVGADAVRWFLFSSSVLRGLDIATTQRSMEEAMRNALNPVWNVWYFFSLYANTNGVVADIGNTSSTDLLDRYVLAKCREMAEAVTVALDATDIPTACGAIEAFLDALTNWYVRRSRDRFWDGDQAAANTLATVLDVTCKVAAPLMPMITEKVWTGLTGKDSVHLADWPDINQLPADHELVANMDLVREVCSAALSIRKATNRRVRLPLTSVVVAGADVSHLKPYQDIISDEVNVKNITFIDDLTGIGERVLTVNPRVCGPRLGQDVQRVIGAAKKGDYTVNADGTATVGGIELVAGEFVLKLVPADAERARALSGDNALVVLDIDTTPELEAEGLARDVVRLVQVARREADLHVSDRITVTVEAPSDVAEAVNTHSEWVAGEILATSFTVVAAAGEVGSDGSGSDGSDSKAGRVHIGYLPDDRAVGIHLSKP
jgi:isoleucyl-tRNA synthetase